jgi:hypothetical protein
MNTDTDAKLHLSGDWGPGQRRSHAASGMTMGEQVALRAISQDQPP